MAHLSKLAIGLIALGALVIFSGYAVDHHRCKLVNYEQARYELPSTFLISAKQCLAAANTIRLRGYARDVAPVEPAAP